MAMDSDLEKLREDIARRLRAIKAECEYLGFDPAKEFAKIALPELARPNPPQRPVPKPSISAGDH